MRLTRILMMGLAGAALAGLVGCSTDSVTGNNPAFAGATGFGTAQFAVADGMDAMVNVDDAALDHPMRMNSAFHGGSFHRHPAHPRPEGSHVGSPLMHSGLTREQLMQIFPLVRAHHERIREQLEGIRGANQPLIDEANEQRQAILESLRDGEITPEEAREQLRELSEMTREAIRANPDNEPFFQAICESKAQLFDEIRAVLTPDQQAKWDNWVANLPGTCLGSEQP